jgi:nucleoside-diphosphate-sugar epimerase
VGTAERSSSVRRAVLVTGGTGTLGRELVARLAGDRQTTVAVLTRDPATAAGVLPPGVRIVSGDVRAGAALGLAPADRHELSGMVTDVVHCAAETTFNRPLPEARATNVDGTRAVLDFARECPRLARVACFSTVYVAGRTTGCFGESDVGGADGFVNSYEQSKAEMELVVREAMPLLPIALYRLSTIIGDSRTGAVTGFNAVHHALRLLYQGLAPMVPGRESALVDLIPVDFAADASHHLFDRAFQAGVTYHLCAGAGASAPLGALLDATTAAFERYRPAWRKRSIARPAIVELGTYELFAKSVEEAGNQVLLQATRAVQAFAYQLAYPKVFDTRRADAALAPAHLHAPPVLDYYDKVVRWCIETNWGAPA